MCPVRQMCRKMSGGRDHAAGEETSMMEKKQHLVRFVIAFVICVIAMLMIGRIGFGQKMIYNNEQVKNSAVSSENISD